MWIIIGIVYLFIGFAIGSAMCIAANDDPNDSDSFGAIIFVGIIWPAILIIVCVRFLAVFATTFVKTLFERFANDEQERE